MAFKPLDIIYQDAYLVAINKPNGLLVHRTKIAAREDVFAMQLLRDQIGQHVFPVHRLDRKTSGVLLFALDGHTASLVHDEFACQSIRKKYHAIVRGYFPGSVELNYALTNDRGKKQEAVTIFETLKTTELDIPFGKHATSRYSFIAAYPKTGRQHQIRKHCAHLRHPIIGDRPHGCNKQNKHFKAQWEMTTMLLHASELNLVHPISKKEIHVTANFNDEFERMQEVLHL